MQDAASSRCPQTATPRAQRLSATLPMIGCQVTCPALVLPLVGPVGRLHKTVYKVSLNWYIPLVVSTVAPPWSCEALVFPSVARWDSGTEAPAL